MILNNNKHDDRRADNAPCTSTKEESSDAECIPGALRSVM